MRARGLPLPRVPSQRGSRAWPVLSASVPSNETTCEFLSPRYGRSWRVRLRPGAFAQVSGEQPVRRALEQLEMPFLERSAHGHEQVGAVLEVADPTLARE